MKIPFSLFILRSIFFKFLLFIGIWYPLTGDEACYRILPLPSLLLKIVLVQGKPVDMSSRNNYY